MNLSASKSLAVLACTAALFTASACGTDDTDTKTNAGATAGTDASPDGGAMAADPMAGLVGSGCAGYAEANPDGPASVDGMAQDKVSAAASSNPLLKTLVAAVSGKLNPAVNLVPTLDGGEFTVFAPVDSAFAKLPAATVKTLGTPAGAETLKSVLTYHVVSGQIAPDKIVGQQKTVQGGTVDVEGSGNDLTVNGAKVICGGVHTQNATVYLIDTVLMPKM